MATIIKFEDILCWQEARTLNKFMRNLIKHKRFKHNFRLINQIEGSAGSIMDNIAEGFDRGGNKEFILFLYYAKGSCAELRSQSYRALDAEYIIQSEFEEINDKCLRINYLISRLINYLKTTEIKGMKFK
jgi:four helix bundle protein